MPRGPEHCSWRKPPTQKHGGVDYRATSQNCTELSTMHAPRERVWGVPVRKQAGEGSRAGITQGRLGQRATTWIYTQRS